MNSPRGRGWRCRWLSPASCNYDAICAQRTGQNENDTALPEPELKDIDAQAAPAAKPAEAQAAPAAANPAPAAANSAPAAEDIPAQNVANQNNDKRKSSCSAIYKNGDNTFSIAMILAAILVFASLLGIAGMQKKRQ